MGYALIRGIARGCEADRAARKIIGVQADAAPRTTCRGREGKSGGTETCDTIAMGWLPNPERRTCRSASLTTDVGL